jgi:hypothetical protein
MSAAPGAVLRTTLEQATPALRAAAAALWSRPGLDRRYVEYLRAMHGVLRASVPVMEMAVRCCADVGPTAPVAAPLRRYLSEHIVEERGHDDWLLADLAAAGVDPAVARAAPPACVARLVGPQYYWILHHDPVALLGYIAVLEGNAPATALAGWIVASTGLPDTAVRTVREHAALDRDHVEEVYHLLDALPLTAGQLRVVVTNALSTVDALMDLYGSLGANGDPR